MILTLEVIGHQAASLGAGYRKEFSDTGGTIGRLPDNDWVLPDAYVSARHARIQCRNGEFFLEDTSSNGVAINSPDNRLQRGRPHALKNGDRLFIDAYEIRVSIVAAARFARDPAPPSRVIPEDPFAASPEPDLIGAMTEPLAGAEETDPMKLLGLESRRRPAAPAPRAADLVAGSPLKDNFRPPGILGSATEPWIPEDLSGVGLIPEEHAAAPGLIPSDYDPLAPDDVVAVPRAGMPPRVAPAGQRNAAQQTPPSRPKQARPSRGNAATPTPNAALRQAPAPAPVSAESVAVQLTPVPGRQSPVAPPGRPATGQLDFAALLRGAGVQGVEVSPELAGQFGQILRVVIEGLMDVLHARERIKDEFRMRVTTFKTTDNNPLKFSANVDDALHNLLVKRNTAYLKPVEAFEDAFRDVRNHQVAMLAGVRVAYEAMLNEFEPEHLQADFDRQLKKRGFLGPPARFKYWELYAERFRDRVRDVDVCFRELFGDEFAKAYEEQLEKLRTLQRSADR